MRAVDQYLEVSERKSESGVQVNKNPTTDARVERIAHSDAARRG
jgi:hypothetical protein